MGNAESAPEPPAPVPAPAPPAPPQHGDGGRGGGGEDMLTLSVTCPPGSAPGQTVRLQYEGQLLEVVVPPGVSPGQSFQFRTAAPAPPPASPPTVSPYSTGGGSAYPGLQGGYGGGMAAPPAAPTSLKQAQKLEVGLVIHRGSVRLQCSDGGGDGGTVAALAMEIDCKMPSRLSVWQAVQRDKVSRATAPATHPPATGAGQGLRSRLQAAALEGLGGELELGAGRGQQCVVRLPRLGAAVRGSEGDGGRRACALVLCLEAADGYASTSATDVQAVVCWCDVQAAAAAAAGGGDGWQLAVVRRQLLTGAGQIHTLEDMYHLCAVINDHD
jgi:hypothetical protein